MSLDLFQALYGTTASAPEAPKVNGNDISTDTNAVKTEIDDQLRSNSLTASPKMMTSQPTTKAPCSHGTTTALIDCVEDPNTNTPVKAEPDYEALDAALAALKLAHQVPPQTDAHPHVGMTVTSVDHGRFPTARQLQLLQPEEPTEDDLDEQEEDEPWTPTGSNTLPLGAQGERVSSLPAASKLPNPLQVPTGTAEAQNSLNYPPTRYLPPAGPYYDQFNLAHVFGTKGFWIKGSWCGTCWNELHLDSASCPGLCPMCGTNGHPGKTCPHLYCSAKWYKYRIGSAPFDGQIRPTMNDLTILVKLGMVQQSSSTTKPIIPNRGHPEVSKFYNHNWPRLLWKKPSLVAAPSKAVSGSGVVAKVGSAERLDSPKTSSSRNAVNANFDPRFQNHALVVPSSSRMEPSGDAPFTTAARVHGSMIVPAGAEGQLQKLEEEVLRLKMENIMKDREIRLLKSEIEQLRSADNVFQMGDCPRL